MDSASIYYKNMTDAMTYDGNMLFGHDRRYYIPPRIDLSARGEWLSKDSKHMDSRDKRYYAHEIHVPDDYMIVDAELFTPSSVREEVRMIRVNPRQVAIPMTWFFKMKDMTIYEQWDFLRVYRLDIPYKLKAKTYLDDALSTAYDLGMEAEFLNMFYDMLRDTPEEFKRRKGLLSAKKKEIWNKMVSILVQIGNFRAESDEGWPELYDELYSDYSNSKLTGTMNLVDYCEIAVRHDKKFFPVQKEVMRVHSKVWYVSMLTDEYVRLNAEYQKLRKQKDFDGSLYTFEDDDMPVPAETEKRTQTITTPKEAKPVITEAKPIIIPRQNPVPKAEPIHKQKSIAAVVQTQQPVPSKTVGARPTTRNRFIDWIIKLVDLVDFE
jgi:hypothetical protein